MRGASSEFGRANSLFCSELLSNAAAVRREPVTRWDLK